MKIETFDIFGAKAGTAEVSDKVFGAKWNADLVHQVVISMQSNLRAGTAHTKDRSEVSGTGKKPWRQKGTGQARHGSRRSPIWRTGGVTFGPRNEKDYSKKINSKMKKSALAVVLSARTADSTLMFIGDVILKESRTKEAEAIMNGLAKVEGFNTLNTKKNSNNALIVLPEVTSETLRAFRNLPHVTLRDARSLSVLDAVKARYIIMGGASASSDVLEARITGRSKEAVVNASADAE